MAGRTGRRYLVAVAFALQVAVLVCWAPGAEAQSKEQYLALVECGYRAALELSAWYVERWKETYEPNVEWGYRPPGGCAWFTVGDTVQDLEWRASCGDGWAVSDETLHVPGGATVTVSGAFREMACVERIELIGSIDGQVGIVDHASADALDRSGDMVRWTCKLRPSSPCFLRIRGSAHDSVFYTNPLWTKVGE